MCIPVQNIMTRLCLRHTKIPTDKSSRKASRNSKRGGKMSRETQIVGLPPEALDYLNKNGYKRSEKPYASARDSGMFEDGPELFIWRKDNNFSSELHEVVQCAPWSSGPCIFLCLEGLYGIRKFQWTEEEIDLGM
jgi:hypothetical protein